MVEKSTVHFVGILKNVDNTIVEFPLEDGFSFKPLDIELENIILHQCGDLETRKWQLINQIKDFRKYCVRRDYEVRGIGFYPLTQERIEISRLNLTLRLMRLGHKGNICMPEEYYIYSVPGKMKYVGKYYYNQLSSIIDNEPFSLEKEEISPLNEFIKVSLQDINGKKNDEIERAYLKRDIQPLRHQYINLAFDNFELSFNVQNIGLSFLTLVTALEVIFGSGAHRVARNAAVLLGTSKKESIKTYKEISEYYEKRSYLLHSGKYDKITHDDMINLRTYCRKCICYCIKINQSKRKLLDELNTMGFGDSAKLLLLKL